jgi:hypothetical protein
VMPVLFANDPKAAEEGMMDNLATARRDLDKLNRAFFVPESLDIEEAAKVAKKPRLGDAEFLFKDWNFKVLASDTGGGGGEVEPAWPCSFSEIPLLSIPLCSIFSFPLYDEARFQSFLLP